MKRAKKLIWLLVTAAMFAAAPLTAMALPAGGYVPTAGTRYYQDSSTKKWVKSYKISYSYKKDGRLTKVTRKYTDGTDSTAYTWKGNNITKITDKYSYGNSYTYTFKFKNKKLTSYQFSGDKAQKIKWKGKTGTCTQTWDGGGATYKYTINGKGQIVKVTTTHKSDGTKYTTTYKYYGNGNLKSYTLKGSGYSYTTKYNQKGYRTSETRKEGSATSKTTFKYKTKKGKIKEVVTNYTYTSGEYSSKSSSKFVFTKWKNVSHVRNCDATGNTRIYLW